MAGHPAVVDPLNNLAYHVPVFMLEALDAELIDHWRHIIATDDTAAHWELTYLARTVEARGYPQMIIVADQVFVDMPEVIEEIRRIELQCRRQVRYFAILSFTELQTWSWSHPCHKQWCVEPAEPSQLRYAR